MANLLHLDLENQISLGRILGLLLYLVILVFPREYFLSVQDALTLLYPDNLPDNVPITKMPVSGYGHFTVDQNEYSGVPKIDK